MGGDIEVGYLFIKGYEGRGGDVYVEIGCYFWAIDGFLFGEEGFFSVYIVGFIVGGFVYI